MPSWVCQEVNTLLFNFIWNDKTDTVKRDIMTDDFVVFGPIFRHGRYKNEFILQNKIGEIVSRCVYRTLEANPGYTVFFHGIDN